MEQDDIRSTRRSFLKAGSVVAGTGLIGVGTGAAATTPGESAGRTTQIGTWAAASQGPDQPGLVDETMRGTDGQSRPRHRTTSRDTRRN